MADIFDEIGEDLRAERAQKLFARYSWVLVVLAIVAVAGAGGWQWWRGHRQHQAQIAAAAFLLASREASGPAPGNAETASRKEAEAAFERLAT
ncbi:MAG: tetratricopeptide repeat protein, partial [Acetobacteraceae bacterium]|nr:tetratricopeptide repeat protein [Acetobacteraceae bacterium]